jgi:IS30 family transposase
MTGYTQLTQVERYQIQALKGLEFTPAAIATELKRHKATISRELRRNATDGGYDSAEAQRMALMRSQGKARARIEGRTMALVKRKLKLDWSPEQISRWLAMFTALRVSHTWIYQYIGADKQGGGKLWKHLRCQKQRRKRYGSQNRRGQIKNRVSIDERPPVVATRERLGDWEIDTIVGSRHSGALLSLTERKSKDILLAKLPCASADEVVYATLGLLEPLIELTHTITADNGKEFSGHEDIARVLEALFYFAHPYSPWERGTNENANGLVRQYFPKSRDFSTITQAELDHAMDRLNNRPRKCLGMLTSHQVLCGIKHGVALAS